MTMGCNASKENFAKINSATSKYYEQGSYAKALEFYAMCLRVQESVLGKNHPDTATAYKLNTLIYYGKGRKNKAWEFLQKSHSSFEHALGSDHKDTKDVEDRVNNLSKELREKNPQY